MLATTLCLTMLPTPHPAVIFQRIDDGAVLFSPTSEVYFGLNEVGAKVWQLLPPATTSIDEICAQLGSDYPDVELSTIHKDVEDLLDQLLREGLVAPTASSESPGTSAL